MSIGKFLLTPILDDDSNYIAVKADIEIVDPDGRAGVRSFNYLLYLR
ncbi:hypothetical protein GF357_01840 [Candidatus Dojkabacteria bacterium]|nr:hypothetical protein [Candidatus Dojkabacteria bacterium]